MIIITTLFNPFILSYTMEALDDQIDSLPYSIGDQQSNQFSGFLNLNDDNDKYIHYMYFESENNPDEDPIVFWYDFDLFDDNDKYSDDDNDDDDDNDNNNNDDDDDDDDDNIDSMNVKDEWWPRMLWIAWYDHKMMCGIDTLQHPDNITLNTK